VDGFPVIRGRTILEKRAWVEEHCDHLRTALMLEPRGHADMYGALLTELEQGLIVPRRANEVVLDAPAGTIHAFAQVNQTDGRTRVASVSFRNVPSFV